jgi:UDP-N-acetylmuramyl tripeptide synthase
MSASTVSPRRAAAVTVGKLAGFAARALGRGGGTALPGVVASRVYAGVARDLAGQLECGSFLISGTNGKTTTARMLASLLRRAGLSPLRNQSGSNLMRGVASSLVEDAGLLGNARRRPRGIGLFEVDEAALPHLVETLKPRGLLLLDLFRDQLDRYGEVATVARIWSDALATLPPSTGTIVNADDPLLAQATLDKQLDLRYFGIETAGRTAAAPEHAGDVKACPSCGGPIRYGSVFLGHLGHFGCPQCGFSRPVPSVCARDVALHGLQGSSFVLAVPGGQAHVALPLPGMYNVYNALGAAAAALWFDVPLDAIAAGLSQTTAAFGRMERIEVDGRVVYLALAKNPAGLNEILRTAVQPATGDEDDLHLMVMLNDNTADGHDVSWIWDADVELLHEHVSSVIFAGTRPADMALRFKYAGVLGNGARPEWAIIGDTESAFRRALAATPQDGRLLIVPTYTALLDIRSTLTRLGYVKPFWEN